jgi:two-component system response regulator YesN
MLEALGWHVTKETNGRTALARFLVEGFDVVLTDHRMPVAGGTMLVEGLRRAGFAGRIVVLSGSLTKLERQHYSALGVDGFGEKPISLDALEALLGGRPQALSGAVNM